VGAVGPPLHHFKLATESVDIFFAPKGNEKIRVSSSMQACGIRYEMN